MRLLISTYILMALCVALLFPSCCDSHKNDVSPAGGDTCDCTVLVYMVGSNTLSGFVESNISDMKKAVGKGALHNGNLLLYIDRYGTPTLERLSLENGTVKRTVERSYDDRNSASSEVMASVIEEVKALYPASTFGLVLWSHANGWYPAHIDTDLALLRSTRSFGDDGGEAMNIDEIAAAIPDSTFDFILCDACYLGASEVAYDLRAECRYYVASPAAVMGAGFPYEEVITHLFSLEKPLVEKLTEVCRSYMDYYRSYRDPYGAVSLVDMSALDLLAQSVNRALRHQTDSLAVDSVQQYSQERGLSISYQKLFFDLDDYVARVCADSSAYAYFADCLDHTVLYADATERYLSLVSGVWCSYPLEKYCGLSAYIPGAVADSDEVIDLYYRTLAWYKKVYAGIDEILIK